MTDNISSPPTKQPDPPLHKPWVGLIAGLLTSGAAHFFAGHRKAGIAWLLAMEMLIFVWTFLLGSRLVPWVFPGLVLAVGTVVLWFVMLVRSYRPIPRMGAGRWVLLVILFVAVPLVRRAGIRNLFHPFYIPTGAMEPTIRGPSYRGMTASKDGDHLFVERYAYWSARPKLGDVIAFLTAGLPQVPQGEVYVKRVVGLPGDRITIRNHRLVVNGAVVENPEFFKRQQYFSLPTSSNLREEGEEYVVPGGGYFVMGDNSRNSFDSRFWGIVPTENIVGRCSKIYWPSARAGLIR